MASSSESHGTHDLNAATNPMTLSKEGLEAARARLEELSGMRNIPSILTRSGREFIAEKAISAYLAALPAPDGLVERLLKLADAADGSSSGAKAALREAATVIQTLQKEIYLLRNERDNLADNVTEAEARAEAAEQQVRDMRDENARMREALTRIAEMDGTAGTEKGPPCEWTKNGVTTIRPSGIGNFANHIARLALKNQESDRG